MTAPTVSYEAPHDRLTEIGATALVSMEADHRWSDGDKAVVMVSSPESIGISAVGYADVGDAVPDVLEHLQALMEASSQKGN